MSRDRLCSSVPEFTDNFCVVKMLGKGSFSNVYLVRPKANLLEQYAVKVLGPGAHAGRAETEIRILRKLGGQSNIIQLAFSFRLYDRIFMCLEFIPHFPFHIFCEDASIVEIRDYIKNLLVALEFIHKHSVIHHDIKPSNFLYDRKRKRYALIDFGLAVEMAPPPFLPLPKGELGDSSVILRSKRKLDFQTEASSSTSVFKRPLPCPLRKSPRKLQNSQCGYLLSQKMEGRKVVVPLSLSLPSVPSSSSSRPSPTVAARFATPAPALPRSCDCHGLPQYCKACLLKRPSEANHAGTAGFRAPETLMNAGAEYQTSAIDLWACGVILLSLLSRRYPFMKPTYCGQSLAMIVSLMGSQSVAAVAKALGVKILHQKQLVKLDLRELCCWYRLRRGISEIDCNNSRQDVCPRCSENLEDKCDDASAKAKNRFCFCHTGRKEHRGPLFKYCVQSEFSRKKERNSENKEEQNSEEEREIRENRGLMFDQAFDLLMELLELDPKKRTSARAALRTPFLEG